MEGNMSNLTQEYVDRVASTLLPTTVMFSILLSIGVLGNIFVLYMYAVRMRRDQTESRYFIPVLAFYDLLVCITSEIDILLDVYFWIGFPSDTLCKAIVSSLAIAMMTSYAFLLAIAIQRYVKICRPHGKQMTLFWRRITVMAVVAANVVYTTPIPVVAGVRDVTVFYKGQNISGLGCFTGNQKYPTFQLIFYSILIFILTFNTVITAGIYTPIACIINKKFHSEKKKKKERAACVTELTSESSESGSNQRRDKLPSRIHKFISGRHLTPETNFSLMFFTIILLYVISYVPTGIVLIVNSLDDSFWLTLPFEKFTDFYFLTRSYVINNIANPFIYVYFDLGFRRHIFKLFC